MEIVVCDVVQQVLHRDKNAGVIGRRGENCDAYRARLQAANDRIKDLEDQLKDCLNKPVPEPVVEKAPLATIYYPINIFRLTKKDVGLLEAVASVLDKLQSINTYNL